MTILNVILMSGIVFFAIGFLHKLGSQKEYLLRISWAVLGIITSILLGSKLAGFFNVQPLSVEIVEGCKLLMPYAEAFVIFVLGAKLLKDTKFMSCHRKSSHHGVNW